VISALSRFFMKCRLTTAMIVDRLPHKEPPPEGLTVWLFLRCLGIIYLCAFASLGTQIVGLIGKEGLLPLVDYFRILKQYLGSASFWVAPSLCWLSTSDNFLRCLCVGGSLLSILLIFDAASEAVLFLL